VATQLLGDRLDLARRHALHVHLDQRRHQRLLRPLVAFEQFRREPPRAVLRDPKLQHPNPRHKLALVVAGPVADPFACALPLLGPDRLCHLRFQNLLHHGLQNPPKAVLIRQQQRFQL
jgi:hypothetical protein